MAIIELPPERGDLTQAMLEGLRLELPGLSSVASPATKLSGIDNIISSIYSENNDATFITRTSSKSPIDVVVVFVKPYKTDPLIMIEHGFLQGLGYNVDGHKMSGTIFSGMPDASLTDDDIAIIRKIYNH